MAIRTPLAPSGCPIAMAPPFTFTFSISKPSSCIQAILCDAKASFNSIRSRSATVIFARCNAFSVAGTGPMPIIEGSTPLTAMLHTVAMGINPYFSTAALLASNMADAPSFIPLLLPAVTVPSFTKAGFSCVSFSIVPSLGCSSFSNKKLSLPTCTCTGISSSAKRFALFASAYFCWLSCANSSCECLPMFHCLATFSAVSPIVNGW